MENSTESPFEPIDEMMFSSDECFLCGVKLMIDTSKEHVLPKWLLHKFNLWDRKLILLNRTSIAYRYLTIPCCSTCNNTYLSKLEGEMENAITAGSNSVVHLDKIRLYQWIGKIFFGLHYREISLALDRSKPELGSIITPEFIKDYRTLHGFLQSIIRPIEFREFFPGSIFVFELEELLEIDDFDYSDNFVGMTFCIRMKNIGIIACLKDDEQILEMISELYNSARKVRLHPIQFDELCAIVFYKAFSMERNGKYVSLTGKDNKTTVVKLPGFSLVPIFAEWDNKIFVRFLEEFWKKWGITYDEIFIPPNSIRTYLAEHMK
jgi:hypothetical protein